MTYLNIIKSRKRAQAFSWAGISPFSVLISTIFSYWPAGHKVRCTHLLSLFKKLEGGHAFDFTLCGNILWGEGKG